MKITIIDKKGDHFALADAYTVLVHECDNGGDKISHILLDTEEGLKHSNTPREIKELLKGRPGINIVSNGVKKDNLEVESLYTPCKYERRNGNCGHEDVLQEMSCNQQNCPWEIRQTDKLWWENHPGKFKV